MYIFGPKTGSNSNLTPDEELQILEAYQDELDYINGIVNTDMDFDTED